MTKLLAKALAIAIYFLLLVYMVFVITLIYLGDVVESFADWLIDG